MKKQIILGLFSLAFLATSCDKQKSFYGTYDATETRTYNGTMMAPNVDLSDQNYLLTVEATEENEIILSNLYDHGTLVVTEVNGSALTIRKQSFDGFLEIDGNGTIGVGVINLNYRVLTPDGNVVCSLHAGKLE